jgi:hypothetical protein
MKASGIQLSEWSALETDEIESDSLAFQPGDAPIERIKAVDDGPEAGHHHVSQAGELAVQLCHLSGFCLAVDLAIELLNPPLNIVELGTYRPQML